jgi:flagellin-like hook-associated protein FlgL
MSVSVIGAQSSLAVQQLVDMRARLDDLQRQLSTGQKSDTYAGIGLDRGMTVSLRAQLAGIDGFNDTINVVMTRMTLAQTALGRMSAIGSAVKTAMAQGGYGADGGGAETVQKTALSSLDELLGLLNTQAGDRYLFSGRSTDRPAVESIDHILNGDGARAGLKQLIAERKAADLGASGLGRLTVTAPTATSVALAEDAASPFGFKLASVGANLTNGSVAGPAGAPASLSVDFTGVPNAGEQVTLRFTLPDGSTSNLTLTATTNAPPADGEFTVGATAAATAANFQTALTASLGKLAGGALTAASAVAASGAFFAADAGNPPLRVAGPPFDSATALVAGTASDSVIWYTGEAGSDPARTSATARVDQSLVISYGARASEDGIRSLVQNVATLAALTISPADPNAADLSAALNVRLTNSLNGASGGQTVANIAADLAATQASVQAAKARHQQTAGTLGDFLQQISGVSNEEVGAKILALQTRLQASMQTTAILFQTSLVNYLR